MNEAVQQFLNDMLAEIDKAASAKVTKAMRLEDELKNNPEYRSKP